MRRKIGRFVGFAAEEETIIKLDEISKRFDIPRAEALRRITEMGLDSYKVYERFGIVKLAEVLKKNRETGEKVIQAGIQRELF